MVADNFLNLILISLAFVSEYSVSSLDNYVFQLMYDNLNLLLFPSDSLFPIDFDT